MAILESIRAIRSIADGLELAFSEPADTQHWLRFPSPVRPIYVTGEFGIPYNIGGVRWTHEGIDLSLAIGTPVQAAASGQVIIAGPRAGYGNCVRILHTAPGGETWWTWYGHLALIMCRVGDIVIPSQQIGTSGNTGNTTGAHLHFTVQRESCPDTPAGCSAILRGCVNPRLFVKWPVSV